MPVGAHLARPLRARPEIEIPGFRRNLARKGVQVDKPQLVKQAPDVKPEVVKYVFEDMATDRLELEYRERMAFPWLADNECSRCGELVCGCLKEGKLQADASRKLQPFEGSTA